MGWVSSSSLNRLVTWHQVLPLLDVHTGRTNALPSVVACPLCCGGHLRIYQDSSHGGEWFHCSSCKAAGDMIELAAQVWKLDIPAAVRKLQVLLPAGNLAGRTLEDVELYLSGHIRLRQQVRQLWEHAQRRFLQRDTECLRRLQQLVGAAANFADWPQQGGQFVGAAHRDEIHRHLHPDYDHRRPKAAGEVLFKGRGWSDVLVIPYWDLPGRICAFMFIGREADLAQDVTFYRMPAETYSRDQAAGLAMLPAALGPPNTHFGNTLFVFSEAYLAIKLHLRWLQSSTLPLPVVAARHDPRRTMQPSWDWLPRSDAIFWSPQLDAWTILQARAANGRVSLLEASPADADNNYLTRSPLEWLKAIQSQAAPWRTALQRLLLRSSLTSAEEILLGMDLSGPALRDFVQTCPETLRERLEQVFNKRAYARSVEYGGYCIQEQNDTWCVAKTGRVVCAAVIRIEQVLVGPNRKAFYRGIISFQGKTVPFTEAAQTIEQAGLMQWAHDYLRDVAGLGLLVYDTHWNRQAIHLASLFHKPETVAGVTTVGWDVAGHRFAFPKFAIELGGNVDKGVAFLPDITSATAEPVPCQELPAPAAITRKTAELLSDNTDEVRLFWAVLACVASNATAAAFRCAPQGILLDGRGAQAAGQQLLPELGCVSLPAVPQEWTHRWPVYVPQPAKQPRSDWYNSDATAHVVLPPWPDAACLLGLRGTWQTICYQPRLGTSPDLTRTAGAILTAYLRDLCERKLWIAQDAGHHTELLLRDIAAWFARVGHGREPAVLRALPLLRLPGVFPGSTYFAEMLVRMFLDRRLDFVQEAYDRPQRSRASLVYRAPQGERPAAVWIPQQYFSAAMETSTGLSPDIPLITQALQRDNLMIAEQEYRNELGWLVPEEWWDTHLKQSH